MGMSADADLIFGIPITSHDEDGEPTVFWDEENEDWVDFVEKQAIQDGAVSPWALVPEEIHKGTYDAYKAWTASSPEWQAANDLWLAAHKKAQAYVRFVIVPYGHYNDDQNRAILSPRGVKPHSGDTWEPKRIDSDALVVNDKAVSKATESAVGLGLDVTFYDAAWYLVASYG